jgi:hypothetical protein
MSSLLLLLSTLPHLLSLHTSSTLLPCWHVLGPRRRLLCLLLRYMHTHLHQPQLRLLCVRALPHLSCNSQLAEDAHGTTPLAMCYHSDRALASRRRIRESMSPWRTKPFSVLL